MKLYQAAVPLVVSILLAGCDVGSGEQRFTQRMAGCAESVNGMVYVMGGMTLSCNLPDVGAYDPVTKVWMAKASLPSPRPAAASAVFDRDIYLIGGRQDNTVLSAVERYSTIEDKWVTCASLPTARWSLMACRAGDRLYVFGGISGVGDNRRALDVVEAYDPHSDSWQSVSHMPEARQGAAIAEVNGIVHIISGKTASYVEATPSDQITDHVDSFDPVTATWTRLSDIPIGRVGAKAVVVNGLIHVVGGISKTGEFPSQIDIYDPTSREWCVGPSLSAGRSGHMCACVGDSLIVFGGSSTSYGSGRPSISDRVETVLLSSGAPPLPDKLPGRVEEVREENRFRGFHRPIHEAVRAVGVGLNVGPPDKDALTAALSCCREILRESPEAACAKDENGRTPLHLTASALIAQLLIDAGADVDARDPDGRTPLHEACASGYVEIVELLLRHGANVGARDSRGDIPLNVARQPEIRERKFGQVGGLPPPEIREWLAYRHEQRQRIVRLLETCRLYGQLTVTGADGGSDTAISIRLDGVRRTELPGRTFAKAIWKLAVPDGQAADSRPGLIRRSPGFVLCPSVDVAGGVE